MALPTASVTIKSKTTTWSQTATASLEGEAFFPTVPLGQYTVTVMIDGFESASRDVAVQSNITTPVLMQLTLAGVSQSVEVTGTIQTINPESSKTQTLVSRTDILRDPDGDRSGSLAMITNNVPGAFVMHDHLHSRGGHGVTWQIDGVPVPNSNLASVGSQFDPKDIDALEANRGGLSTNYGDRAYGVFNIVPRSGFEDSKFGDVALTYGTYNLFNGYLSLGDHSANQKWAYFASGSGNRTDRGLERVAIENLHNDAESYSGFTSILYNPTMENQFRLVGSARTDRYQVPNTQAQAALGIDDREIATDALSSISWLHTSSSGDVLTVSPYYHFNRGRYLGGETDPLVTTDDRTSHYIGGYASYAKTSGPHTLRIGTDSFFEHDDSLFALRATTGQKLEATQTEIVSATVASVFAEDTYRVASALTLNGGLRFEHFSGTLDEHELSPRIGATVVVPHIGILRGSYSHYYQHPQTSTISGPILDFALQEGFDFLPVPGERDKVYEIGLGIPLHGWTIDVDGFHNTTKNAVDHEVLGNSNILFPLTIEAGRVRAFEATLRSPLLAGRLQVHSALSVMQAQGKGKITGGLTDFQPPANEYFSLDHDQRVTWTSGGTVSLPADFWVSGNVIFGSGFLRGDGPDHMPAHTTADIAVGKDFGKKLAVRLSATNVTDALYLTGFENSFAGTHYANPREVSIQAKYKFHY